MHRGNDLGSNENGIADGHWHILNGHDWTTVLRVRPAEEDDDQAPTEAGHHDQQGCHSSQQFPPRSPHLHVAFCFVHLASVGAIAAEPRRQNG